MAEDKKTNDTEIKKALECCDGSFDRCGECPLDNVNQDKLRCWELEKSALDLINRLQAENDGLKTYIQNNGSGWGLISHLEFCKNLKAEAYKEFAEELLETKFKHGNDYIIYAENIYTILKEKVGDNNES